MTESNRILDSAEVDFLLDAAGGEETAAASTAGAGPEQAVTMRGNLDQINLSDIFQTLAMTKMEGVLEIQSPLERRQVYCKDGYVQVLVPPRLIHRRIGQRLVSAGLITAEQLRSALMRQRKERKPIGTLLIEDGVLTGEQIEDVANTQIAEDLFGLFTWRHGTFAFYKGEVADPALREKFSSCPEFEVSSLLLEIARRSDEWESILKVVGNLDEIPVQCGGDEAGTQLGELEYSLYRSADGQNSYRSLAEQTTQGLFDVARAARDLVRKGLLANLDDAAMLAVADAHAQANNQKQAVVVLQTLRDRPGDRPLEIVRAMAQVLRSAGEPRLAGLTLLEVARLQTDAELALQLAREANSLAPHDSQTLLFLRQMLLQVGSVDEEFGAVTVDLLDAMLEADQLDPAIALVGEMRELAAAPPPVLLRGAKAHQKRGDVAAAIAVLLEIAEVHRQAESRSGEIETFEAILRLDRTHKDAQRALHRLRQTKIGRMVRAACGLAVLALLSTSGLVWWNQRSFEDNCTRAGQEIGALLRTGDRLAARERLEHWCTVLGEGDQTDDLRRQVDFADASELARQTRVARKRIQDRLVGAATALETGRLDEAFAVYQELLQAPEMRAEVAEVVRTRVDALLASLDRAQKSLAERMPPEPTLRQGRAELQQNLNLLQSLCTPALTQLFDALDALQRGGSMPTCIDEARQQAITDLVQRARTPFDTARARLASYATAIANATEQRQFDPTFKEAMRREEAQDFAGALDLYRLLEKLEGIDAELRAMFRDRKSRNATIVRLLEAEAKATAAGDFETARQHLRALRTAFPDVPFDRLVRLPLRLETLPPGAKVLCGGQEVAVTPCVITYVPAETTRLTLQSTGFLDSDVDVTGEQTGALQSPMLLAPDQTMALDGVVDTLPAVDGDLLWLVDRSGAAHALENGASAPTWTFKTGDLSGSLTAPVTLGDLVLCGSLDGELRALRRSDGQPVWSLPELPTESPLAIANDRILLATTDDRLVVVDPSDRSARSMPLPGSRGARMLAAGSRAFVLTGRAVTVVALPAFTPAWTRPIVGAHEASGALVGGTLVVLDDGGTLQGLDAATGEPRWRAHCDAGHLGNLCALEDAVLVTLPDRILRFAAPDGTATTLATAGAQTWSGAATLAGKHLLLPTTGGAVDVRDIGTGALRYRLPGSRGARAMPCRDGVLVTSPDRTITFFRHLP